MRRVFVTGGTGYIGRHLIPELLQRGHEAHVLVRKGSEHKVPQGSTVIVGNALDESSYAAHVDTADTFVHLVGVSHPNPSKADQFRSVDFGSLRASVSAASAASIEHFVYVSVAQPAPVMKAYVQVRSECEASIRASGLNATILRPWYVLGPGHRWPVFLVPAYWVCERLAATKDAAQRLGLVTLKQMVCALLEAIENPYRGLRILEVPEIRQHGEDLG